VTCCHWSVHVWTVHVPFRDAWAVDGPDWQDPTSRFCEALVGEQGRVPFFVMRSPPCALTLPAAGSVVARGRWFLGQGGWELPPPATPAAGCRLRARGAASRLWGHWEVGAVQRGLVDARVAGEVLVPSHAGPLDLSGAPQRTGVSPWAGVLALLGAGGPAAAAAGDASGHAPGGRQAAPFPGRRPCGVLQNGRDGCARRPPGAGTTRGVHPRSAHRVAEGWWCGPDLMRPPPVRRGPQDLALSGHTASRSDGHVGARGLRGGGRRWREQPVEFSSYIYARRRLRGAVSLYSIVSPWQQLPLSPRPVRGV
jgi:hypothetical protein